MRTQTQTAEHVQPAQRLRRSLALAATALVIVWLLFWYRETAQSIESIWRRSETFAHGYVIVPIVVYLVWRDRHRLARLPIAPTFVALPFVIAAGFGWLVAQVASVIGGAQFMLTAMIPLSVWALLGTTMLRALAFPLAFLFFAVPFGEFAVPKLMDWTADFAVVAVSASGVPVFREGNSFIIPSGRWSVVEACSGVRYLIASLVVGTLYAYLTYRSWQRRAAFIVAAIAVPLVANWVRAYLIVMIGHVTNNRLAAGVDHVIYGWVFFGVVMALMFAVASIWREDATDPVPRGPESKPVDAGPSPARIALIAAAIFAAALPWTALYARLEAADPPLRVRLDAIAPAAGWAVAPAPVTKFRPDFANPLAETTQYFVKGDRSVGVFIGYYAAQTQERELVSHHNQLATTANKQWREVRRGRREASVGGVTVSVRAADVIGESARLAVWHWYWIDGSLTASDIVAKALLAWSRLTGRGDDSAVVVIFTADAGRGGEGESGLREFAADLGESIGRMLREAEAR